MPFHRMNSKIKATAQKLRARAKERIHPDDTAAASSTDSQAEEQQRTMTDENVDALHHLSAASADLSSSSSILGPFSSNHTTGWPSSSANGMGTNQQSYGTHSHLEVLQKPGSKTNPIDLMESPSNPGSSSDNPIDLTVDVLRETPNFCSRRYASPSPDAMEIDQGEQNTQIENDRRTAQLLQLQPDHRGQDLPGLKPAPQSSVQHDPLTQYKQYLQSRRCVGCSAPLSITPVELVERTKKMLRERRFLHPSWLCHKCTRWSCVGGDKSYERDSKPPLKHVASGKGVKSTWCCGQGRLFLIFSLLCGPQSKAPSSPNPASKPALKVETPSSAAQSAKKGRFRQSHLSRGTGYGDSIGLVEDKGAHAAHQASNGDFDNDLQLYFLALSSIWPSDTATEARLDPLSSAAAAAMLSRSPMLHHAAELLRHAAIEEINTRRSAITAVLDFLESIGRHAESYRVLLRPAIRYPPAERLPYAVLGHTGKAAAVAQHEATQSLAAIVEHLAVPCRKFVETSRKSGSSTLEEDPDLFAVVQRICVLANGVASLGERCDVEETRESPEGPKSTFRRFTANVSTRRMRATAAKEAENSAAQDLARRLSEWHRANCLRDVPDATIMRTSCFAPQALEASTSAPAPGRMKKLLAQVSSLSTDLPEGIYVRHGESRVDVLKVLIVGPAGTPYEHGFFEFDMFCDSGFPLRPPHMFFRTTGGGTVRFNPNLYANGKVCLSLLGTWQGHPWEPERSSILQILVSIQAMVFNDEPYYNEPGHELRVNPREAQLYNRTVEYHTVTHAINSWLADRLAPPGGQVPAADESTPSKPPTPPSHGETAGEASGTASLTAGSAHPANASSSHAGPVNEAVTIAKSVTSTSFPNPLQFAIVAQMQLKQQAMAAKQISANMAVTPAPPQSSSLSPWPPMAFLSSRPQVPHPENTFPGRDDPIWGDVIREHFALKAKHITSTVHKWETRAKEGKHNGGFGAMVQRLEDLLQKHGFHD